MNRLAHLTIHDDGFIFDPSIGESFTANATGLTILRALKDGRSAPDIVRELREQFEHTPPDAERDVADFIEHLRVCKLVPSS